MLAPAAVGLQGNTMNGSAVQVLEDARSLEQLANPTPLKPGVVSPNVVSTSQEIGSEAPELQAGSFDSDYLFELNGYPIQLCTSGLPCWDQLEKAAGMN